MKVCTTVEMHAIEAYALSELAIPSFLLDENAAFSAGRVLRHHPEFPTSVPVLIACGPGLVGAAGLALARQLHAAERQVQVLLASDTTGQQNWLDNVQTTRRYGVSCNPIAAFDQLTSDLSQPCVVVDALSGAVSNDSTDVHAFIDAVNERSVPVLSLDIPSGICPDTGRLTNHFVRACATLAFGLPNRGNFLSPGASYQGRLYVTTMGLPPHFLAAPDVKVELVKPCELPTRVAHGHKGTFGDILFIAGAGTYYGAPGLAALASLKAGAGYARLACPASMIPALATFAPEVVFAPQRQTLEASLTRDNLSSLLSIAQAVDFVVVGPGLSLHPETQGLVRDILVSLPKPLLVDGDGLSAIVDHPDLLHGRSSPTVLTPHPGEMARLLHISMRQVLDEPIEIARQAAVRFQAIIVLKGPHSIVAHPNGETSLNTSGNSGMGTAGSGDVLTGTIAAMAGLGLPLRKAVQTGVFIHGFAGDLASETMGADGMTARDILFHLPEAIRIYRKSHASVLADHHGACTVI